MDIILNTSIFSAKMKKLSLQSFFLLKMMLVFTFLLIQSSFVFSSTLHKANYRHATKSVSLKSDFFSTSNIKSKDIPTKESTQKLSLFDNEEQDNEEFNAVNPVFLLIIGNVIPAFITACIFAVLFSFEKRNSFLAYNLPYKYLSKLFILTKVFRI